MGPVALILVSLSGLLVPCFGHWNNDFDRPLKFKCHDDASAITRVVSQHSNHHEDRRFELFCSRVGFYGQHAHCHWSNFVNNYDQLVHYTCPGNAYINGMYSIHHNHYEDRIWKFRCCSLPGVHLDSCVLTGWTNNFDREQDFSVHSGYVIKGSVSMHNNHVEDRLYEFLVCRVVRHCSETQKPQNLLEYLMIQSKDQETDTEA